MKFAIRRQRRAIGLGAMLALLLSGCAAMGGSETERALCAELRADLPSWSASDSAQSLEEAAAFLETFDAVCGVAA